MSEERTDRIYVRDGDADTATSHPPAGVDLAGWVGLEVNAVKWAQLRRARQDVTFKQQEVADKQQEVADAEQVFVNLLGDLQARINREMAGHDPVEEPVEEPVEDPEPDEDPGEVPADD